MIKINLDVVFVFIQTMLEKYCFLKKSYFIYKLKYCLKTKIIKY